MLCSYFIAAELEKQIVESLESQVSDGGNRAVVARKLVSHNFTLSFLNDAQLPRHLYREVGARVCTAVHDSVRATGVAILVRHGLL